MCIGDYVWSDLNRNGVQDAGESGVAGVRATLFRADGAEVLFTLSDSNGVWRICGVVPGSYFVRFTGIPADTAFTVASVANPSVDSDPDATGTTPMFAVGTVDILTIDAGIIPSVMVLPNISVTAPIVAPTAPPTAPTMPPATQTPILPTGCIGDKVFRDPGRARDGVGIPGAAVELGHSDGSKLTAVTDAKGSYMFCLVPPGNYTVRVSNPPANSTNSYDLDGNLDNTVMVTLALGQSNADVDFGYVTTNVAGVVVTQTTLKPAPASPTDTPSLAYTGARSTMLVLWAFTFLLVGYGMFGLTVIRRRRTVYTPS